MSSSKCLESALSIVFTEVEKIKEQSYDVECLSKEKADMLNNYVKTLLLVNKDEREVMKQESLSTRSNEELIELAEEATKYLEEERKNVKAKQSSRKSPPSSEKPPR